MKCASASAAGCLAIRRPPLAAMTIAATTAATIAATTAAAVAASASASAVSSPVASPAIAIAAATPAATVVVVAVAPRLRPPPRLLRLLPLPLLPRRCPPSDVTSVSSPRPTAPAGEPGGRCFLLRIPNPLRQPTSEMPAAIGVTRDASVIHIANCAESEQFPWRYLAVR